MPFATRDGVRLYWILNAFWEPLRFEVPPAPGGGIWRRWIDTALESPEDIVDWRDSGFVEGFKYSVGARSTVLLYANLHDPAELRSGTNL